MHKKFPDTVNAIYFNENIALNGRLDETIWHQADKVSNLTQTEPDFEKPATEKTQVAIIYSSTSLFIGIWCYQTPSTKISSKSLQSDFDFEAEDDFRISISPFNDVRAGYDFGSIYFGRRPVSH